MVKISGSKAKDCLDALQDFISDKLPVIAECELSPAEVAFILHQLAWTYHNECDMMINPR